MAAPIFPASALNRSPVDALRDAVDALTKRVAQLEADRPQPVPDYRRLAYNLRMFQKEAAGEWHPQSQRNFINAYEAAVAAMREATGFYIEGGVDGVLAELDSRANESPDRLALRVSDLEIKRDEFEKRLGDVEGYLRPLRDVGSSPSGGLTMQPMVGADDPAVGSASPRTATSPTISEHNAALALGAISEALNVRISADYMNGFPAIRAWPDGEKPMNTPGYHAEHQNHLVDPVLLRRICSAIDTAIASHEYQQGEFRAALQPKTKFDKPEVVRETDLPGLSERAMVDRMLAAIARATGRVITSTDGDDNVARFAGDADDRDIALFGAMLDAYKHWNLNDEPWSSEPRG